MKDISTKGLLKQKKVCTIANVVNLLINLCSIGAVLAAYAIGHDPEASQGLVLGLAGGGLTFGTLASIGTGIIGKTEEKIDIQLVKNKEFEAEEKQAIGEAENNNSTFETGI